MVVISSVFRLSWQSENMHNVRLLEHTFSVFVLEEGDDAIGSGGVCDSYGVGVGNEVLRRCVCITHDGCRWFRRTSVR